MDVVHGLPGGVPDQDGMRAGDADRNRAIDVLKAAFAEGRLTQDELTWRQGKVLTAKTYGDLKALIADLPVGPLGTFRPAPRPAPRYPYPQDPYQQSRAPVPYAPGYGPVTPAQKTNGLAIASVVAPFFFFLPIVAPVTAIVCGHVALEQIDRTGEGGRGMALAGVVLGYLEVAITLVWILIAVTRG